MGRNADVEAWFEALDHPLKPLMIQVREVLLAADPRIEESLKWKSPTYGYRGNLVSIDSHAKRHVSLLFHQRATIPGAFASLEGGGAVARYMRLADASELEARSDELRSIAVAWCEMKDGGRTAPG